MAWWYIPAALGTVVFGGELLSDVENTTTVLTGNLTRLVLIGGGVYLAIILVQYKTR